MLLRTPAVLTLLALPLLAVLAGPAAAASPDGPQESAVGAFAITFVVLLVGVNVLISSSGSSLGPTLVKSVPNLQCLHPREETSV